MQRAEKTLIMGKIEGGRRRRQQRIRLDSIIDSYQYESEQILGDREGQRSLACCCPRVAKSRARPRDWRTTQITCSGSPAATVRALARSVVLRRGIFFQARSSLEEPSDSQLWVWVPVFLLSVRQGPLSAPKSHLHFFPCASFHLQASSGLKSKSFSPYHPSRVW